IIWSVEAVWWRGWEGAVRGRDRAGPCGLASGCCYQALGRDYGCRLLTTAEPCGAVVRLGVGPSAPVPLGAFPVLAPAAVRQSPAAPASRSSPGGVSPPPDPTPGDGQRCQGRRRRGCGQ